MPSASPPVIASPLDITSLVRAARESGHTIAVVPTMGALHEGHLSLVREAKRVCTFVVTTIFVNPTQFGPQEDLAKYPRTLASDLDLLARERCDLVFAPSNDTMYPPSFSTFVEPPRVASRLEGAIRPGHFRGVATVVLKLFQLVPADVALFGHKDYQQTLVIRHMVRDLNVPIAISVRPTVREPDGLALSSRNAYLNPDERRRAVALSQALFAAEKAVQGGERNADMLRTLMEHTLTAAGVTAIDYVAIADPDTLEELPRLDAPAIALIAARVGSTRLIDNLRLEPR